MKKGVFSKNCYKFFNIENNYNDSVVSRLHKDSRYKPVLLVTIESPKGVGSMVINGYHVSAIASGRLKISSNLRIIKSLVLYMF